MAMVWNKPMTLQDSYRVQRIKLFHDGHSFNEIDSMSLEDFGDVIGYTSEQSRGEKKLQDRENGLKGKR